MNNYTLSNQLIKYLNSFPNIWKSFDEDIIRDNLNKLCIVLEKLNPKYTVINPCILTGKIFLLSSIQDVELYYEISVKPYYKPLYTILINNRLEHHTEDVNESTQIISDFFIKNYNLNDKLARRKSTSSRNL